MARREKTATIKIRCRPETKRAWEAHGAGFDNQAQQLRALLEAYANETNRCRSTTFDFSKNW
jgi:hypothetical protein